MRINVMAATYPAQDPSIRFQSLDDKSAIHSGYDIYLMEENKPFSHEEIRCRERVICIFPNDGSALRLIGALLAEKNDVWQERRYLDMDDKQSGLPSATLPARAKM